MLAAPPAPTVARRAPGARWGVAAALVSILLMGVGQPPPAAGAGDRSLRWRTLHTAHFRIHCPQRLVEPFGRQVAKAAEEAWALLVPQLGWEPDAPIDMRIEDDTDWANGFASTLPYNLVVLYAVPPTAGSGLSDYDDWLRLLVYHELTHIVHLDRVGGVPALLNRGLGRTLLPNLALPRWLQEGVAVWQESNLTGAGRIRSSLFRAQLRMAALAGRLPTLDELSAYPEGWPWGTGWYLFGSSLVAYLVEQHGPAGLASFSADYSGRLLPYGVNRSAQVAFGITLEQIWTGWHEALTLQARAEQRAVLEAGLVAGAPLTDSGETHSGPRWSADGSALLYYREDAHERSTLRLRSPVTAEGADQALAEVDGAAQAAWRPGGGGLVFAQANVANGLVVCDDLFERDLASGHTRRLTHGLRASQPDLAPDGAVVFVAQHRGRSSLMMMGAAGAPPQAVELPDIVNASSPRFDPSGERITFSGQRADGARDIYVFSRGRPDSLRRLTHDRAMDLDPAWSPDGRALYFSSDRRGTYDIYRLDIAHGGGVRRVTRVLGAALSPEPAPDGRRLAFVHLGAGGYDLHVLELPPGPPGPLVVTDGSAQRRVEQIYSGGDVVEREQTYSPLRSLLPRAYTPSFGGDTDSNRLGVLVAGQDAAGHHAYMASVEWDIDQEQSAWAVGYSYRRLYPTLSVSLARSAHTWQEGYYGGDAWYPYEEEVYAGSASVSVPFSLYRVGQSVSLAYTHSHYEGLSGFDVHDPAGLSPQYPTRGRRAGLRLGWALSDLQRFPYSVSPERGTAAGVRFSVRDPSLGSDDETQSVSASVQRFVPLPLPGPRHQVLSLRVAGGLARGDSGGSRYFSIGGPPSHDVLLALIDETYVGSAGYLRGYPPGVSSGDRYALLNAEWRIPVLGIHRGLGLLPVHVERVVASPFFDMGSATLGPLQWDALRRGAGVELRTNLTLGYYLDVALRVGYARGLDEGAEDQLYVLLGNVY